MRVSIDLCQYLNFLLVQNEQRARERERVRESGTLKGVDKTKSNLLPAQQTTFL